MDQQALSRALRTVVWPPLVNAGFLFRTERIAWRHADGHVDLIEVCTLGSLADPVGATPTSFDAHAASWPAWLAPAERVPIRNGLPAPHYWHCALSKGLPKTLRQPWFRPFGRSPTPTMPRSFLAHREALQHVVRRDTHDRADIWYVLDDGSNLVEVVRDLLDVVASIGLPLIESFHRPAEVIRLVEAGDLAMRPGSPAAREFLFQANSALHRT